MAFGAVGLAVVFFVGGIVAHKDLADLRVEEKRRDELERVLNLFSAHLDLGDMYLRGLESLSGYWDAILKRYSEPDVDLEKLNADTDKAMEYVKKERKRLVKWKKEAASDIEKTRGRTTASLFRNHAHISVNRRPPESLADDRLWADSAGCLQWIAEWLDEHAEQV